MLYDLKIRNVTENLEMNFTKKQRIFNVDHNRFSKFSPAAHLYYVDYKTPPVRAAKFFGMAYGEN